MPIGPPKEAEPNTPQHTAHATLVLRSRRTKVVLVDSSVHCSRASSDFKCTFGDAL